MQTNKMQSIKQEKTVAKNYTLWGALAGVALAVCIVFGGWELTVLALVLGGVGALTGAHFEGRINAVELWDRLVGRGRG